MNQRIGWGKRLRNNGSIFEYVRIWHEKENHGNRISFAREPHIPDEDFERVREILSKHGIIEFKAILQAEVIK